MSSQFQNGYALLIAVNESASPAAALRDIDKDVLALQGVLSHPERCGYPADNIKLVMGKEATREGILTGLEWLQNKLAADKSGNTTAVIYYTGHGHLEGDRYFFVPYDIRYNGEKISLLSLIPAQDIAQTVSDLAPKRLLVMMDCCHAGGMDLKDLDGFASAAIPPSVIFGTESSTAPQDGGKGLEALGQGAGRAILSSSLPEEKSWVRNDRKMSIFTYHLIEALTGHAQPKDGSSEVIVSDVMSYVWRHVPISAKEEHNAPQHPDYRVNGNFPVALLLGGKGLAKGEPAPDPIKDQPVLVARETARTGGVNISDNARVDVGGDLIGGSKYTYGDSIDLRGATGAILKPQGPVTQTFGNQTNTGGGAYIGGNVDNRGGQFAGRDMSGSTMTTRASKEEFNALLQEIRNLLSKANLDADEKQAIEQDLVSIQEQSEKTEPKLSLIKRGLNNINDIVTSAAGIGAAAVTLTPLIQRGLEMAGQLFK